MDDVCGRHRTQVAGAAPSPGGRRRTRARRPFARAVLWLAPAVIGLAAALPAAARQAAATQAPGIEAFAAAVARAQDDPRTALRDTRAALDPSSADLEGQAWTWLAVARIHGLLEQPSQAVQSLESARRLVDSLPGAGPQLRLMLQLQQIQAATLSEDPGELRPRLDALWPAIQAQSNPRLSCEAENLRSWILLEVGRLDDAFHATQRVETCAADLLDPELRANAAVQLGMLAARVAPQEEATAGAMLHYTRALDVLGTRPARYLRSIIEWELGKYTTGRDPARALAHFERARALSLEIADDVGVALAAVDIAFMELGAGHPARALDMATDARNRYLRNDARHRVAPTYAITIAAMTTLRHPRIADEIAAARQYDNPSVATRERARLAAAMAHGFAALGQYENAYGEMRRSAQLTVESRNEDAHATMQRLQAIYESAQRDAENARLRLRDESARLQLEAAAARQQTLWIGLLGLGAAFGGAALLVVLTLRQRRALAALALRDELTGAPNRRAILSQAQAQFAYARRLGLPFAIALIDLDHFKRVNDSHGHEAGDRALQAFAAAARGVLRAHDGLGRYGGEEWLVVMPGADIAALGEFFARLRARFADTPIDGLPFPHRLTFSAGAVEATGVTVGVNELIAEADRRLYRAKADGRDRLVAAPADRRDAALAMPDDRLLRSTRAV